MTVEPDWKEYVEKGLINDQQAKLFYAYEQFRAVAVTTSELSDASHLELYMVRRRSSELFNAKVLIKREKRKCRITGVTVNTWIINPEVKTYEDFRALMLAYQRDDKKDICSHCNGTGKLLDISFLEI